MIFIETKLTGAYLVKPQRFADARGFFARVWCEREFSERGLVANMVQANIAYSEHAMTLRGLHYQEAPHAEAKLLRCLSGAVYDVVIDLRTDSPTYKHWLGTELTARDQAMIYVPEGFAHGYLTLQDNTEVFYQVSEFYAPAAEKGIRWDDPAFAIEWPAQGELIISDKDRGWRDFEEAVITGELAGQEAGRP